MDDEQGNVFDGTARSHEWRRRRSKLRSEAEAADGNEPPRSEAPKGIAPSLLVPAGLVHPTIPRVPGGATRPGESAEAGDHADDVRAKANGGADRRKEHRNPFLSGADSDTGETSGRSDNGWLAAVLALAIAVCRSAGSRVRSQCNLLAATARRRARAIPLARPVVVAVGVMTMLGIGVAVIAQLSATPAPIRSSGAGVTGTSLERMKPALLSAVGNPVGGVRASRRPRQERSRRVRAHRAIARRPRAKAPAAKTVAARYAPSSNSGSSGSGTGGSYESTGSTSAGSSQPAAQPASASSPPKTTAFGAAGALGPGSSPNG